MTATPSPTPDGGAARKRGRPRRSAEAGGIDAIIGARIRLRRGLLGLSQTDLGGRLGVSFQQVQRYEAGANSVTAARLMGLSDALDVPVSYFLDGLSATEAPAAEGDFSAWRRQHLTLITLFERLPDSAKPALISFLNAMEGDR